MQIYESGDPRRWVRNSTLGRDDRAPEADRAEEPLPKKMEFATPSPRLVGFRPEPSPPMEAKVSSDSNCFLLLASDSLEPRRATTTRRAR